MAKVSLEHLQQAADHKYEGLTIEGIPGGDVKLLSPLKMSKAKRQKLVEAIKSAKQDVVDEAEDQVEQSIDRLHRVLRLGAEDQSAADRLLKTVGQDLTVLLELVSEYSAAAQPGEAAPSPS